MNCHFAFDLEPSYEMTVNLHYLKIHKQKDFPEEIHLYVNFSIICLFTHSFKLFELIIDGAPNTISTQCNQSNNS
jgi:hypothetical protein